MDTQNIIKPIIKPATQQQQQQVEAFEIPNSTTIIGKEISTMELRNVAKKPIRDIFLDNSYSIEEAEIFYPSKMNEGSSEIIQNSHPNALVDKEVEQKEVQPFLCPQKRRKLFLQIPFHLNLYLNPNLLW